VTAFSPYLSGQVAVAYREKPAVVTELILKMVEP
jgi:hypothetical protein